MFVRRTECTPRTADRDWGEATIAILILRRRYVRNSSSIPYGIVHDSRMIDLLVRGFSDKIGQGAVRYETLNDTPSYTSNRHDVVIHSFITRSDLYTLSTEDEGAAAVGNRIQIEWGVRLR